MPPTLAQITQRLSAVYGFPVPAAFAPLVRLALEQSRPGDQRAVLNYYGFRFSFDVRIAAIWGRRRSASGAPRYPLTPPEYVAFGWLGADGVSYGYLVHAPEQPQPEYPIVEEQPIVGDGLILFGADTARGIEAIFSRELAYWKTSVKGQSPLRPRWQAIIDAVSALYGIAPHADKSPAADARYTPPVPSGWRFLPTRDSVGVLAPAAAFAPDDPQVRPGRWGEPAAPALDMARSALAVGAPATALWLLRETFFAQGTRPRYKTSARRLLALWGEAYQALGRPLLAQVIDTQMRRLWR